MYIEKLLIDLFAPAFEAVAGHPVDPMVRRSSRADFQIDGALALSRKLGRNVAAEVLGHVKAPYLTAEVAGPGFINVTLADDFLAQLVSETAHDDRLGVPLAADPEVVTIDYSAPNVAKEMHVGHLRSTVIGDAAARLLSWLGHDVRRMNHVGDWGTPFGMLIEHLLDMGETEAVQELSVGDLTGFYHGARAKFNADPEFVERSRLRVVALQSGDPDTLRWWRLLVSESERYFVATYAKLGVTLSEDDFKGESFYDDMLHPIVEELGELGLLRESDGAKCVFPSGFSGRDGEPLPVIVRKRDGGFGYGATDLASIRYRIKMLKATRMLYVVGSPQRQHFEMVFAVAREAGWLTPPAEATFVGFGSILGPDGKMLRTRTGDTVKLVDLLDEAIARAAALVPHLDADLRAEVAQAVGIGAVKYADLSTDRVKDYVFDWDRMLATNGDTAAYLQFAYVRANAILRKADNVGNSVALSHRAERVLALELLDFPAVLESVAASLEFQKLTTYLFSLAVSFTSFVEQCRVLGSDAEASRLVLCDVTQRTIATGLHLLGIETPARM